jgi:hypothetical protein
MPAFAPMSKKTSPGRSIRTHVAATWGSHFPPLLKIGAYTSRLAMSIRRRAPWAVRII